MMKFLKKAYLGIILLVLYAPIALLMVYSFNESKTTSWQGFSLKWYVELFNDPSIQRAFYYTIVVASLAAIISTVIGTMAALGINKMSNRSKNAIMNLTYIPLLSPDIVIGISLMLLFTAVGAKFGLLTLVLSHITFCTPYVILSVMPRLKMMNSNLYEAALDLGASPSYAFKKVILPEILPGIVSGAFIAFTLSIDDFVVSFFNTASGVNTLSIQIYSMARRGVSPKINAISTLMFTTIMLILIITNIRANIQSKQKKAKGYEGDKYVNKTKRTMKKSLGIALAVVVLVGVVFSVYMSGKATQQVVYVYNWGDYIDEEVNRMFEEETGIKVVYEVYPNNEDMYAKLQAGGSSYDVLFPSDYMVEKMINQDMLAPIDPSLLTNYGKIDEELKNLSYDPENMYSVPYLWGTMGIVYNTTMIDETIDEWADFWNPEYAKQVFIYDSEREALMIALKKLGYSMNSRNPEELEQAKQELIALKPNILAYVGDEGKGKMENGEAAMMLAWAGDAMLMTENNPDLAYVIPQEGTNLFVDAMVIPKTAQNKENAHAYIDFLCRPEIAALNAEYVGYSTPINEARQLLPEEMKDSEIAYPDTALFDMMEMFNDPAEMIEVYSRIWTEVKAAK